MGSITWRLAAVIGLVAGATAGVAEAHVGDGKDRYFFDGSLYKGDNRPAKIKDPVNLYFGGGSGGCCGNKAHAGSIGLLLDDDWSGAYENRMRREFICQSPLNLRYRHLPGSDDDLVEQDFERLATNAGCRRQYHIRGYEDGPHWKNTDHGRRD